jgi:hypothetical protein
LSEDLHSTPPSAEPPVRRFVAGLERLAGSAALLGVCGYLSLRAHFNYLGISSLSYLGLERYLMETYTFVADLLLHALTDGVLLAAALLPLGLLTWWLLRRSAAERHGAGAAQALRQRLAGVTGSLCLLAALLAGILLLLASLQGRSDIAVGLLAKALVGRQAWRFDAALAGSLLGLLLVSAGQRATGQLAPALRARAALLWRLDGYALALLAFILPVVYGQAAHPTRFPLALAWVGGRAGLPECGLVVLATKDHLSLWQAHRGIGRILVVPNHDVAALGTGPLMDLLERARREALHPSGQGPLDCGAEFPP